MRNINVWHEPPSTKPPADLVDAVDSEIVAHLLNQRGITTPASAQAFLDPTFYAPAPPEDLPDLETAANRLQQAIQRQETILVWGDFDVDGQTSTALLIDGLQSLGAKVVYYVPNRLKESHGILIDSLATQLDEHRPSVLLTCDTGVSALDAVDYAKSLGVTVLVTDHHDLPPQLPAADAVVNPKRLPPDHRLATLPGVGVAYKLLESLHRNQPHHQTTDQHLDDLLDLVALGIVADVATQTRDTRYLLQLGMEKLRTSRREGIRALLGAANLHVQHLTAQDIAFQIGPRLNAAGRLADARPAIQLLTTRDPAQAQILAAQLEALNRQRRFDSLQITAAAQAMITRDPALLDWEALVLSHVDWHPGIIGIVASQLAEQYNRPVVLLSTAPDGTARGSARSAPGYDIGAAIAAQSDLLLSHGGHPGAAGLTLPQDNIPAFRRRLSDTLHATRDRSIQPGLPIDMEAAIEDITESFVNEINRLAPFGEGNPPVTIMIRDLHLKRATVLGRTREHRRLTVANAHNAELEVLWWRSADKPLPTGQFDIAINLAFSTYQNARQIQAVLVDRRPSAGAPDIVAPPRHEVTDLRHVSSAQTALTRARELAPDALIWAEGLRRAQTPGIPATQLTPSPQLIIYTAPASPADLRSALDRTGAYEIILIGADPPQISLAAVEKRLLELVKWVMNHQDGRTHLTDLTSAIGHTAKTIVAALEYAQASGKFDITWESDDALHITTHTGQRDAHHSDPTAEEWLQSLRLAIEETSAYRAHFRRAEPRKLLGWDIETP